MAKLKHTMSDASRDIGELSPAEMAAVLAMRAEQDAQAERRAFQRKAIDTAHAFEQWSAHTGEGLTFSTFVNTFGYQDSDSKQLYEALQRIQQAALPLLTAE